MIRSRAAENVRAAAGTSSTDATRMIDATARPLADIAGLTACADRFRDDVRQAA